MEFDDDDLDSLIGSFNRAKAEIFDGSHYSLSGEMQCTTASTELFGQPNDYFGEMQCIARSSQLSGHSDYDPGEIQELSDLPDRLLECNDQVPSSECLGLKAPDISNRDQNLSTEPFHEGNSTSVQGVCADIPVGCNLLKIVADYIPAGPSGGPLQASGDDICSVQRMDEILMTQCNHTTIFDNPRYQRNIEQQGPLLYFSNSAMASPSESRGTPSIYTEGQAQVVVQRYQEHVSSEAEQNQRDNFTGGRPRLARRLLVQKFLTASDVGTGIPGIMLPKEKTKASFFKPDGEGLEVKREELELTMHDGEEEGKTWSMRLMKVDHTSGSVYRLKRSLKYIVHHALKENDLLQIIREDSDVGEELDGRYILTFKRCLAEHIPLFDNTHTGGRTWRLIFQKVLVVGDVEVGPQSVGSISLGRKEVEDHFPPVLHGGSLDLILYDWSVERTWITKLKRIHHKKCDLYRLQNMAEFLRSYAVEEGDLFAILRSDAPDDVRYAVQMCKPLAENMRDRTI